MKKSLKLIKLDRRHVGYGTWKYYIDRPKESTLLESKRTFFNWRVWCWEQWGPSKEMSEYDANDLFDNEYSSNPRWCWVNDDHGRCRIYFKDDTEVTFFILSWA
jgi:hypothetical protein